MLSTGSLNDAPLLASSDSDIFALVAANGRAMDKSKDSAGVSYKIADCDDVLFIRAQSTIRADGFSSAQYRNSAVSEDAI